MGATSRARRYDELLHPHNPPASTGDAPAIVVGLWYFLAPLSLLLLTLGFAIWYWGGPATAIQRELVKVTSAGPRTSPGGFDPNPVFRSTNQEIWFRGGWDLRPPPLPEPPRPQPSR